MAAGFSPSDSASGVVLTLDVGTSSVRCLAFDTRGEAVPGWQATHAHEPRASTDGASELDAPALLQAAVDSLAAVSSQAAQAGRPVLGVGACSFWHAFLAVDGAGEPLTPIYLWNDTRAATAAQALQRELDGPAVHERTGCVLHPSYLPARLRWLRATRPDVFDSAAQFVSFGEYLERHLLGVSRVGLSMASGTGLLNRHTLDWDAEVLGALGLDPGRLSPLVPAHAPAAGLRPAWAEAMPALRDVPFFPALGDGACSNLGSGAMEPALGALMVGTSGAVRVCYPEGAPAAPAGLWRYLLDTRRGLIGGAVSNGGNLFAWMQRTLQLPPPEALEAALLRAEPAAHGLSLLPFLTGERNPDYPLDAHGLIAGITGATTPVDLVQAALEAVAFRLASIVARLRAVTPELAALLASGGLLRSPAWLRILTDVIGLPLQVSAVPEASSRGAALLALEALGLLADVHRLPPPVTGALDPDPARHARYVEALAEHEALYRLHVRPGI